MDETAKILRERIKDRQVRERIKDRQENMHTVC
jgi:hypothetical protein